MKIKKVWLFLGALLPRLVYIYQVKSNPFFNHLILDPLYYDQTALNILKGNLLAGDQVFDLSPLYPYFLACIYAIFGHNLAIARLIQHIIGAANCVLLYIIAKRIFNNTIGAIAYIISTLYGIFIFYEGILETETLVLFINSLIVLSLLDSKVTEGESRKAVWLISGILIGLSAIIRPNILILFPFLLIWLYCKVNRQFFSRLILIIIGSAIIVLPVTLRNYITANDIVLISSSGGLNFYIGNNAGSTGILTEPDFIMPNPLFEHKDARAMAEELAGRRLTASQASKFWFKKGLEFIIHNPVRYIWLLIKKAYFIINYYEVPDNINYYFFKRFSSLLRLPLFSSRIVIPLGLVGICLSLLKKEDSGLLYIFFLGYGFSLLLFFISSRYRLPMIPFLIIFSAYCLYQFYHGLRTLSLQGHLIAAFLLLISISLLINRENKDMHDIFLSQSYHSLATIYYKQSDFSNAMKEAEEAVDINPYNAEACNSLAWIYAQREINLDKALSLAATAVSANPDNPNYYDTLGWIYYKRGMIDEAIETMNKGLFFEPDNKDILRHIREILEKY